MSPQKTANGHRGNPAVSMRTLVLNAGYEPLSVVSFKRALVLVMNGRAVIVESDNSHPVRSPDGTWERPSVIVLTRYVKMPHNRQVPCFETEGCSATRRPPLCLLRGIGEHD